eukprot:1672233-Pleurochrysis_carterae.AAC.2
MRRAALPARTTLHQLDAAALLCSAKERLPDARTREGCECTASASCRAACAQAVGAAGAVAAASKLRVSGCWRSAGVSAAARRRDGGDGALVGRQYGGGTAEVGRW